MCVPKPCSVALMKSTPWSIDLACGLIDAVFKNSLVWGMGELQGSRRSCRAHLSMFTEPGTFIQQQEKGHDGGHPVSNESLCHSVPDTHKTHVHSPTHWEKKLILCMYYAPTCLCNYYWCSWSKSAHPFLWAHCRLPLCNTSSLVYKSFILTDTTHIHCI